MNETQVVLAFSKATQERERLERRDQNLEEHNMIANPPARFRWFLLATAFFGLASLPGQTGESTKPKFSVKFEDLKTVFVDIGDSGPVDPTKRINFSGQPNNFFIQINTIRGETLHLSHFPTFMINGRAVQAGNGGRFEVSNAPLPKSPGGKARVGTMSVWAIDNLRITQSLELHPSKAKAAGEKRISNNVLVTHTIENKGAQPATVGMRIYMDTYVINNDGCLFASPVTHPGKILDGMILQDKTLPPYLQMLQVANLQNPGYVSHLTLNVGSKYEKANKLILTRHGAGFGGYDMPAQQAMFDSAIGLYFETKEIKPGGKRDLAYVYGEGIAVASESEGRYQLSLGGSFEPGKTFTVSATVADPAVGQTLSLELPKGMQRLEGKEIQPVASLSLDNEYSTVLWKCRVLEPGQHTIRVRSSTGITQTKVVTITHEK